MTTYTEVHETHSFRREWRINRHLRYDVVMQIFIMVLINAANLYMIINKIPLDDQLLSPLISFTMLYLATLVLGFVFWVMAIDDVTILDAAYITGRVCHTLGFFIFLGLFYSIHHRLALYLGLPCLIWFVPAMIAPCCPPLWIGEEAWWKFVNQQREPRVPIV